MTSVVVKEISQNTKVGPSSATYASQRSCPSGCPLRDSGCYGEGGNVGFTTRRLNKSEDNPIEIAKAEADGIDKLTGLLDLRLHVVGDCPDEESVKIVSDAAMRFRKRLRPTDVWTYHHAWKTVARALWQGVSVLASCHSHEEVLEAMQRGYAPAMTVKKMPKKAYKKDGITYVPCREQVSETTCVECRLCFDDMNLLAKKIVILFELHTGKNKAYKAIQAYLNKGETDASTNQLH